jgi:hypothetical protein
MAHITADRVRQLSTSTGTTPFVLSASLTGFRDFSSVLSPSDTFWYAIASLPGSEWEVGLGTWGGSNTFTRTTVLASSNAGAAVVFSAGTKEVFITAAASKFLQQDSAGSYGNFTAGTITAALTGAASSNVLKAGDTMTGALVTTIGGGVANSTKHIALTNGSNYDIFFTPRAAAGSYNTLTQAGDALIGFSAGAIDTGDLVIGPWSASGKGIRIDAVANTITIGATSVSPAVTNTQTLGASGLLWSNVYATTFTGALTGNASGSAATFTSTSQNSQFNSIGVGVAASTTAGQINATNLVASSYVTANGGVGQLQAVSGSASTWYNAFLRNDGANVYLLSSAVQTTQANATNATFNAFRPFSWSLTTGAVIVDSTGLGASFGGNITPSVTNTKTLGTASLLWNNVYATTFTGALTGNSTTATTLQTSRTFTIGNTGKSFNGGSDVSWTHAELGAVRNLGNVVVQGVVGTAVSCTTDEFITWLTSIGAFAQTASVMKCTWSYANNNDISDTGFGTLETAGCIIETFTDGTQYIVRITSPSTGLGAGGIHEYTNHGVAYSPGWRRVYTSSLNGNITGSAATLTTSRNIWGQAFTGAADVTGNLTSVGNITGTAGVTLTATAGTLALAATGANSITATTNATTRLTITSAGDVGIGTAATTAQSLGINKNITGGTTAIPLMNNGAIQADVTGAAWMFRSSPSVVASAFTLPTLAHFSVVPGTLGASSTITNEYGTVFQNTMVNATNTYGVSSNIVAQPFGAVTPAAATATSISQTGTTVTVTATAHTFATGQYVTVAATANATALTANAWVTILTLGDTNFTLIGAASNTVGLSFTASGPAAALTTGTVTLNAQGSGKLITVVDANTFTYTTTSASYAAITLLTGVITPATRWNIYASGTAPNYFAGSVGIGYAVPAGLTNVNLRLAKTMVGGNGQTTSYAFYNAGQIQTDVTTSGIYNQTVASTAGAVSNIYHNIASQGTLGGTVTNQYGFVSASNAIGATNNYGFVADNTAGVTTGKVAYGFYSSVNTQTGGGQTYGFYAAGTASNYFAGNVGIGTNAPAVKLEVVGAQANFRVFSTDANPFYIPFIKSRGTAGAQVTVNNNDNIGALQFYAYNGTNEQPAASIVGAVDGVPSSTSMPGRLIFNTTPAGSNTTAERMRIDNAGNVGIGTAPTGYRLSVVGSAASSVPLYLSSDATNTYVYSPNPVYLGSTGAFQISFVTNNTEKMRIDSSGNVTPGVTNTQTLGAVGDVWSNVHATTVTATFHESAQTISTNYTITAGNNAMTPGPITIASGITVTVPSGSVWTIV